METGSQRSRQYDTTCWFWQRPHTELRLEFSIVYSEAIDLLHDTHLPLTWIKMACIHICHPSQVCASHPLSCFHAP